MPDAERVDLLTDELLLVTPADWPERSLRELSGRPFVMEPATTPPAGLWATGACRQAGYEPDIRYRTTDLQIDLRLVEEQLAVALLPELSGARSRRSTTFHPIEGRPARQIFTAVRRGATNHPAIQAFTEAIAETPRNAPTTSTEHSSTTTTPSSP